MKTAHKFLYEVKEFSSWESYKSYIEDLCSKNKSWVFRGQSDPSWPLSTSLERCINYVVRLYDLSFNKKHKSFLKHESYYSIFTSLENTIIDEYKKKIHLYLDEKHTPITIIDLLSLMQHHGAPTRLLDFTKSPYIAPFFSLSDKKEKNYKEYLTVWAIDCEWLLNSSREIIYSHLDRLHITPSGDSYDYNNRIIIKENLSMVRPVEPKYVNERYYIQQGIFLMQGDIKISFEENLKKIQMVGQKNKIKKLLIPVKERFSIMRDLNFMNINNSHLFPGLDGFSKFIDQSISSYYNILFDNYQNSLKNNEKTKKL